MSTETIDTLNTNITFQKKKSIFSIYNSPKNSYHHFEKHINQILNKKVKKDENIIIIGDSTLNTIQKTTSNYVHKCLNIT